MKHTKWGRKVLSLLLVALMVITMLPTEVFADQANGWNGHIQWSTHGPLYGHYLTNEGYYSGILCLEPEKGADSDGFHNTGEYGYNDQIAQIAYLSNQYVTSNGLNLYWACAAWAVGTGMVYDVVEGHSWGTTTSTLDCTNVTVDMCQAIEAYIKENMANWSVLPGGVKYSSSDASANAIEMTKQSDGSYTVTLSDAVWNTDAIYHGFQEMEGSSGTIAVDNGSISWSRNESSVTFTVPAATAKSWSSNGGNSPVITLTKRIGNGDSSYYPIWKGYDYEQTMVYVKGTVAAYQKGYLAFHAEAEPGHAYFTKSIKSNADLAAICGQYSTNGTEITVYNSDWTVKQVLTITDGKTEPIELDPDTQYYYAETKAAPGFKLDNTPVSFSVASGQTFTADIANEPLFDPMQFVLKKEGKVDGKTVYLPNAEFTLYYFTNSGMTLADAQAAKSNATRTWVFKTDASGYIYYDDAHKVSGPDLFKDATGKYVGLPGTYLFVETNPPEGFKACDPFVHHISLNSDNIGIQDQINIPLITDDNIPGYAYATKAVSVDEDLINICPEYYSLDGTEITFYHANTNIVAATLTIKDGKTEMPRLSVGDYYAKETKAPAHFNLDPEIHSFTVTAANTADNPVVIEFKDAPKFDALGTLLKKTGRKGGVDNQPIPGAVFKVTYYPAQYDSYAAVSGTPVRTWYFITDANGEVKYDAAHLAEGYTSDALFTTAAGKVVGLPGTYALEEVKAPTGYTLANPQAVKLDPNASGFGTAVSAYTPVTFVEESQKIFIQITKIDPETGLPVPPTYGSFAGAVFNVMAFDLVKNEMVIVGTITTDENGAGSFEVPNPVADAGPFYTSYFVQEVQPSPGCLVNPQMFTVNPGIAAINIPEIIHNTDVPEDHTTITIRKVGYEDTGVECDLAGAQLELRREDGTVVGSWTTDGELKIFEGLPVGTYYIYETNTLDGYLPLETPVEIVVEETDVIQNFNVINNRIPTLKTTAIFETGSKMGIEGEEHTVSDAVEMMFLASGSEYTLAAELLDIEDGSVVATGSLTWRAEAIAETRNVELSIETTGMAGKTFVVVERLYQNSRSTLAPIAEHVDETDTDQQVYIPEIRTTAYDAADEDKVVSSIGTQTIVDVVKYSNLIADGEKEYTVSGVLMNADTGKALLNAEGNEITSTVTFKPEAPDGEVEITFTVDGSLLGFKTVVFEDLYEDQIHLAFHKNLTDEDQAVYTPSIKTQAKDQSTDDQMVAIGETITMIDTISYENLLSETTYAVTTTIMVKSSGNTLMVDGKAVTKTAVFVTPAAEDGEAVVSGTVDIKIPFTFTEEIVGDELVVFESIKAAVTGIIEAEHKDITDKGQTVSVPEIGTQAIDQDTTTQVANPDKHVVIEDTVSYKGLIADGEHSYTVEGTLMDKESGRPIKDDNGKEVTASVTFTPETSEGEVVVTFTFPYEGHTNETIVAYEYLYYKEVLLCAHARLDVPSQMIFFPEIKTYAKGENGTDTILAEEEVTITDTVYLYNVPVGKYTLEGELMLKETDEEGNVTAKALGITATKDFEVTEEGTNYVAIEFTFDASSLKGTDLVVFETLKSFETKTVIAEHKDPSDEDQDIHVPDIHTTALDKENGTHMTPSMEEVTIVDRVFLDGGLVDGREYTVNGILMDKKTGEPLLVGKEEVTSSLTFTFKEGMEYVDISFTFNAKELSGKVLVVYETLKYQDFDVAVHMDIEDSEETIYVPIIKTKAVTSAGSKTYDSHSETVTIIDTLSYENLEAGREYHIVTTLVNPATGKVLTRKVEVTNSDGTKTTKEEEVKVDLYFTPKESKGEVSVTITAPMDDSIGSVVVFEKVYLVAYEETEDGEREQVEYLIGSHEDLTDKDQTVYKGPDTGDSMKAGLYLVMLIVSFAGMMVFSKKRRKKNEENG